MGAILILFGLYINSIDVLYEFIPIAKKSMGFISIIFIGKFQFSCIRIVA